MWIRNLGNGLGGVDLEFAGHQRCRIVGQHSITDGGNPITMKVSLKVRTVCAASNGDWKTALARGQKPIPAGTELEIKSVMGNFYGMWLEVDYNGSPYSIAPKDAEYISGDPL